MVVQPFITGIPRPMTPLLFNMLTQNIHTTSHTHLLCIAEGAEEFFIGVAYRWPQILIVNGVRP